MASLTTSYVPPFGTADTTPVWMAASGVSGSNESSPTSSHGGHGQHQFGMVLYLFGVLTVGALARHLMKGFPIPYTVIMFIFGNVFGVLSGFDELAPYSTMADMDGHLILTIFLPALIFESSFDLDLHIFKKSLSQCLTMATVGIAIATVMTALAARMVFPYGWDWPVALLYGCIASATDPVAVVSLLAEVGASKKLATVIEGESLLNDGTAIVFFAVLLRAVSGENVTFETVLISVGTMCICGPLLGLVFGVLVVFWLERVHNDALVEITITLVAAYSVYYIAELLHLSGVLAVVVLGTYVNAYEMTISKEVLPNLHKFWHMVGYLANTVIFASAGLIVSKAVISSNINLTDVGLLMAMYIILTIIRGTTLAMLSPFLNRIGYNINWRIGCVITWGGLRGAVGLALALVVNQDSRIDHGLIGSKILFQIGGFVMLTLVVNAPTVKLLLSLLKLDEVSPLGEMVMQKAVNKLAEEQMKTIRSLKANRFLSDSNWMMVEEATTISNPNIKRKNEGCFSGRRNKVGDKRLADQFEDKSIMGSATGRVETFWGDNFEQDLKEAARGRFLNRQKIIFHRLYEEGVLEQDSVRTLEGLVDKAMDSDVGALIEIEDLVTAWQIPQFHQQFKHTPGLKHFIKWRIQTQLSSAFDIGTAFIIASEESISMLQSTMTESARRDVVYRANQTMRYVHRRLDELQMHYYDITLRIKTKHSISHILQGLLRTLNSIKENGIVDTTDIKMLKEMIEAKELAAGRLGRVKPQSVSSIFRSIGWVNYIVDKGRYEFDIRITKKQAVLYDIGEEPCVMIVTKGLGKLSISGISEYSTLCDDDFGMVPVSAGSVIGLTECACDVEPSYIITSDTKMEVQSIPFEKLRELCKAEKNFDMLIWQTVGRDVAMAVVQNIVPWKHMPLKKVKNKLAKGSTMFAMADNSLKLDTMEFAVLARGTISVPGMEKNIEGPYLINDSVEAITTITDCYIFAIHSEGGVRDNGPMNTTRHRDSKFRSTRGSTPTPKGSPGPHGPHGQNGDKPLKSRKASKLSEPPLKLSEPPLRPPAVLDDNDQSPMHSPKSNSPNTSTAGDSAGVMKANQNSPEIEFDVVIDHTTSDNKTDTLKVDSYALKRYDSFSLRERRKSEEILSSLVATPDSRKVEGGQTKEGKLSPR